MMSRRPADGRRGRTRGRATILLAALLAACSPAPRERPGVVLIVIDTLRADHLGCYGYRAITTPNIDALASRGVRATRAMSHVPITLPSFSTLLTSTLPPTTGVHDNEGFALDASARTLAEILGEAGWSTRAVLGSVVLSAGCGLAQGFDRYDDRFDEEYVAYQPHTRAQQDLFGGSQRRADDVTARALAMADSLPGDRPFFLMAHYFDPHVPYDPPPPWFPLESPYAAESAGRQAELYDGEIAFTDRAIGDLLSGLEARGLLANTLIVLTADHGEGLGGHGERTHAFLAYDQTLHVPLIFSMPGVLPEGRTYEGLARLIDVAPTILDVAGVPLPADAPFQGRSLLPFEGGEGADFAYFETAMPFLVFGYSGLRGVRGTEWKYIDAPRPELYRIGEDPGEARNLASRVPAMADSLRATMGRILAETPVYGGGGGKGAMSTASGDAGREELRERLLALGYLGPSRTLDGGYEAMFAPGLADPKERIDEFARRQEMRGRVNAARLFVETGRFREGLRALEGAPGGEEGSWRVHFYRGRALAGLGQRAPAVDELRAALEGAPVGPERVEIREALRSLGAR